MNKKITKDTIVYQRLDSSKIKEHDLVYFNGDMATIIHIYPDGKTVEIEKRDNTTVQTFCNMF